MEDIPINGQKKLMIKKKESNFIFILIMGFGMSLFMTLIITYINTMDSEFKDFLKHGQYIFINNTS